MGRPDLPSTSVVQCWSRQLQHHPLWKIASFQTEITGELRQLIGHQHSQHFYVLHPQPAVCYTEFDQRWKSFSCKLDILKSMLIIMVLLLPVIFSTISNKSAEGQINPRQ